MRAHPWFALPGIRRRRTAGALLPLAALAAALVVGPPASAAPGTTAAAPPTGPARNGALIYGKDGDIWIADTPTGAPRLLIGGAEDDRMPFWSPDGTRILFERHPADLTTRLMIADADGGNVQPVVTEAIDGWGWVEWSPDATTIAGIRPQAGVQVLSLIATDGSGAHRELPLGDVEPTSWLAFRGSSGSEIVFKGVRQGDTHVGYYTIGVDGTGLRSVLVSDIPDPEWPFQDNAISPDGNLVASWSWEDLGEGANSYVHLLDLTTGQDQVLDLDPAYPRLGMLPHFMPDGTSLLFETGPHDATGGPTNVGGNAQLVLGPLDGSTPARPLGEPYGDHRITDISPDGTTVLQTPDVGSTLMIDVATGANTTMPDGVRFPSWQRLAP